MYRREEVISKLFGRVGFKQSTLAEYASLLDAANTTSKSGRYFNWAHAVVTIPNLKEIVNDDINISNADFNTKLKELQEESILSVLDGVFNQPEIIEQRLDFDRCDDRPVLIQNNGLFVGRAIKVVSDPRKTVNVNALTLSFNGDATFNVYLFNSTKKAPLKTQSVTSVADDQVVVTLEGWMLNYMNTINKSGVYYIGYFQDDLPVGVQAYDERPWQWNQANCYLSEGIEVQRVPAQVDFQRYNPYRSNRTYGLNIEFSSVKDYTEIITQQAAAFDKAISLQMAAKVVEMVIHSPRSNQMERIGKEGADKLYNDLNLQMPTEEMPYSTGLKNQLDRELKRLNKQFFPKKHISTQPIPYQPCSTQRLRPWG